MGTNTVIQFTITGSRYHQGSWDLIARLKPNNPLVVKREPTNEHDPNAVMVLWGDRPLGYLPRGLAAEMAPLMDRGLKVICRKAARLDRSPAPPITPNALCDLAFVKPTAEELANADNS